MYWILQTNLWKEDAFKDVLDALVRLELPHSIHKVIPFGGGMEPEANPPEGQVVVMGSYALSNLARTRGWSPGTFLNDNFDFEIQLKNWGTGMLNHDAWVGRLADVPEQENAFFIRPTLDTKSFSGEVMSWPIFDMWRQGVLKLTPEDKPTVTGDTRVVVARKKEIYSETRTWIVDKQVVTASGYKLGTQKRQSPPSEVDDRIIHFARACAHVWSPDRAYVLDIFDTPDGLYIGEANNLNSSGFYKGDMARVIMAIEDMMRGK